MTKDCDIEKNKDIQENPVHVTNQRCPISQKLISNLNNSSKSNTECITEIKTVRIHNKIVIIANSNEIPFFQNLMNLKSRNFSFFSYKRNKAGSLLSS